MEGAHGGAEAAANVEVGGGLDGFGGIKGRFGGEDAADAGGAAAAAEALAQQAGERTGVGVGEVGGDKPGGVGFAGGAEAGEDVGDAGGARGEQEFGLGQERINGVDQYIAGVVGEKVGRGVGVEEEGEGGDLGVGVDVAEEAGGGIGFGFSDCGVEGKRVAVQIGGAEFVEVNENEVADGGAGEGFGGGGADGARPAMTTRAWPAGEGVGAEKKFEAGEGRRHGEEISMALVGRKEERISFGFWRCENQPASLPRCRSAADHSPT